MNKKSKLILGIDPGYAITGFSFISEINNKFNIIDYGVIKTDAKTDFAQRLKILHQELNQLIKKYKPQVASIENIYFAKNAKTAMMVGQARGVIMLTCILNNLEIFEFTPLQIKQAVCGYGQADKLQVQNMVKNILKLNEIPKPDDAADALAVAITYLQSKNFLNKTK